MSYYCELALVKNRVPTITSSDTTYDVAISGSILEASAIIDNAFSKYNLTVNTGSQVIVPYICADFAAALFWQTYIPQGRKLSGQMLSDTDSNVDRFWRSGYKKLSDFFEVLKKPLLLVLEPSGSYNLGYNYVTGSS